MQVTNERKAVFAKLTECFTGKGITIAGIFGCIAKSLEEPATQQLGYALANHARDILEQCPAMPAPGLMAECYVRSFFNAETAALYGTESLLAIGQEDLMIERINVGFALDARGVLISPMASAAQ